MQRSTARQVCTRCMGCYVNANDPPQQFKPIYYGVCNTFLVTCCCLEEPGNCISQGCLDHDAVDHGVRSGRCCTARIEVASLSTSTHHCIGGVISVISRTLGALSSGYALPLRGASTIQRHIHRIVIGIQKQGRKATQTAGTTVQLCG